MQDLIKMKAAIARWNRVCPHHALYFSEVRQCEDPRGCILNFVETRGMWHCGIERAGEDGSVDGSVVTIVDLRQPGLIAKITLAAIDHNLSTAIEMDHTDGVTLFASPTSQLHIEKVPVHLIRSTRIDRNGNKRGFRFAIRVDGRYQEVEVDQRLENDGTAIAGRTRHIAWPGMPMVAAAAKALCL